MCSTGLFEEGNGLQQDAPCWPDMALVSHLFLPYGVLLVMVQLGMIY